MPDSTRSQPNLKLDLITFLSTAIDEFAKINGLDLKVDFKTLDERITLDIYPSRDDEQRHETA